MALFYDLDNNTSEEIIIDFQKEVCEAIKTNKMLKDSDLCVIKVLFYEDEEFLFESNYVFLKSFIDNFELLTEYHVRSDKDEENIRTIKNMTGGVLKSELDNYKHKKFIEKTLEIYRNVV